MWPIIILQHYKWPQNYVLEDHSTNSTGDNMLIINIKIKPLACGWTLICFCLFFK